jgi:uncharacterized integral membrane protein
MLNILSRIVYLTLFVLFFGFALKNTDEATLHLFWGYEIGGPLAILLLGFFGVGAAFSAISMLPMVFRQRRELAWHRKELASLHQRDITPSSSRTTG